MKKSTTIRISTTTKAKLKPILEGSYDLTIDKLINSYLIKAMGKRGLK